MTKDAPLGNNSKGRKKIEMKLIKKKASRMVTFSKRGASLFRKASELATLCNAHVAIMIFSPGGKIYSFGHPSVGSVIERYESSIWNTGASQLNHLYRAELMRMAAVRAEKTLRLKMELQQILDDIEARKGKIKMLDMVWEKEQAKRYWWNAPIEEINMAGCKALEKKLMDLKIEVEAEMLKNRNQAEDSKKDLINQGTTGKNVAPSMGDLAPNHSAGVLPNNIVAGWINSAALSANYYMRGPSNQGSGFNNFGGSTSTSGSMLGPSSSTVGTRISHGLGPKALVLDPTTPPTSTISHSRI